MEGCGTLRRYGTGGIKGENSYGKAAVVTLLVGPLVFLVKGKNVQTDVPQTSGAAGTMFGFAASI